MRFLTHVCKRLATLFAGAFFLLILPSSSLRAQDVLILKNGDRISGEIKKLNNGELHFDADYGENIFIIDWDEVDRIESGEHFVAETSDGQRLIGSVKTNPEGTAQILVEEKTGATPVQKQELVYLKPIDEGFWGRLSASVDLGLSVTKADENRQFSTRGSVGYLTEVWSSDLRFSALRNARKEAETLRRNELNGDYRRNFSARWFGLGLGNFLQSDELQLDLRSSIGGGVGNLLVRNNRWRFSAVGGAVWTNENFSQPELTDLSSAEAFAGLELNAFDIGDLSILSSFTFFPSITESGRIRFDFSTDFRWEIIDDLYFSIGFTDNYDNSTQEGIPNNDYVFNTAVGWSF